MNGVFTAIFQFLIYTNIWVSMAAASLAVHFFILNDVKLSYPWLLFIFCITFIAYNFQRLLKESWPKESPHKKWVKRRKHIIYTLLFIAILYSIFVAGQLEFSSWTLLFLLGIVSLFYSGKWLKTKKNFRRIPYIKIYLIALSWAVSTVLLPASESSKLNETSTILLFFCHFFFILAVTIPFDIRDLKFDDKKQKTIPQIVGIQRSKIWALIFLLTSILMISFYSFYFSTIFGLSCLIPAILIWKSNTKRSQFYYSGWLEGSIIITGISAGLFGIF